MATKYELQQEIENLKNDRDRLVEALAKIYALTENVEYRDHSSDVYAPYIMGRIGATCHTVKWDIRTIDSDQFTARVGSTDAA